MGAIIDTTAQLIFIHLDLREMSSADHMVLC